MFKYFFNQSFYTCGLEKKLFIKGDQIAEFEVGHRIEEGCGYMVNPVTGKIEQIFGHDFEDYERLEIQHVETRSGKYDVFDVTFAKLTVTYERKET